MSLHAYRNIGFKFIEQENTCEKWRKVFTDFNPEPAARILNLRTDQEYIYIDYFHVLYRLAFRTGVLEKRLNSGDPGWTEDLFMNEALVIYHILGDVSERAGRSGEWVPESELDPVSIRHSDRLDPLLNQFAREFGGRLEALDRICLSMGAEKYKRGDGAWIFRPFDTIQNIAFMLIFYDGDEEFAPRAQVLTDQYVTDYMHFEAAGCVIADILEKISGHLRDSSGEESAVR